MRFWELVSAFRSLDGVLERVLNSPPWRAIYADSLRQIDALVLRQDRSVLDASVPLELSRSISALDPRRWTFDPVTGVLRARMASEPGEALTTLQVHDRFGGSCIEEVCERGSVTVMEG
jgi:hypothetical protein